MTLSCVYDCAHPLWGGDGICSTNNDDEAVCVCSPGYASKDVMGNPSCVPTIILWSFFLLGAVVAAASALFLVWHIMKYFDIRESVRHTRKAILRLQILAASSTLSVGVAVCCTVVVSHGGNDMAGGEANLWDFYIIQTILAFLCPPLLYMFPLLIEYWLLGLPSQNGLVVKVQDLASSCHIFPRTGVFLGAIISAAGAISYSGSRLAFFVAEMIILLSTDLGGIVMAVIGFEMVAVIKLAERAGNGNNDGFYRRAKRRIWYQVFGCCLILVVNTIALITLFFTHIGRSTPVIPMGFHFCCGLVIACPFAHLTAFTGAGQGGQIKATSGLCSRPYRTPPIRSTFKSTKATTVGQPGRNSKEEKLANHQDSQPKGDMTKMSTSWKTPIPATPGTTLPAVRGQPWKVVPVLEDENV